MTIVVGYVPTPEGEAALDAAITEARLREQPLHVVNSSRGDVLQDPRFASERALDQVRAKLDRAGVIYEIDQRVAGLVVIAPVASATPALAQLPAHVPLVTLDGEMIEDAQPVIGYMHRSFEKLAEYRDARQTLVLMNRHDWLSAFNNEMAFIEAVEREARIGNEGFAVEGFRVLAPFVSIPKDEIVRRGAAVGVPFAETWSCYVGGDLHCGRCGTWSACSIRARRALRTAGRTSTRVT